MKATLQGIDGPAKTRLQPDMKREIIVGDVFGKRNILQATKTALFQDTEVKVTQQPSAAGFQVK